MRTELECQIVNRNNRNSRKSIYREWQSGSAKGNEPKLGFLMLRSLTNRACKALVKVQVQSALEIRDLP